MAKKTKVLTKSAVAAALAATAVVPVIAAPASAATAPVTEVVYVVDGKNVSLSFATFTDALNAEVLTNLDIKYVKAADGNYYSFEDFSDAINASDSVDAALELLANNAAELAKELTDVVEGTVEGGDVIPPINTGELTVESVTAITKTKVEVKFNVAVDEVSKENFTIEGGSVDGVELSEDKKTATLSVSDLAYATEYTVVVKNLKVEGETVENAGSAKFTTPAVTEEYTLKVTPAATSVTANGADNTVVKFELLNANGEVDKNADNMVLEIGTTFGNLATNRVTVQDGVGQVVLTSEFSKSEVTAKVTAQIIEASTNDKELIGKIAGEATIKFIPSTVTTDPNAVTFQDAESNQADRVILYFDKAVSPVTFVKTKEDGSFETDVAQEEQILKSNVEINISQDGVSKNVVGIIPVVGNDKAVEVLLDKNTTLKDNAKVDLDVKIGTTRNQRSFTLTDARQPEFTGVTVANLRTLNLKFSEAVAEGNFSIDGIWKDSTHFDVTYGDFNPKTGKDERDTATVTLNKVDDTQLYFDAGTHSITVTQLKDFAATATGGDKANISTTQTLNFSVAADPAAPTATVTVESPEQFRVTFNKDVDALLADGEDVDALFNKAFKVYDEKNKKWVNLQDYTGDEGKFKNATDVNLDEILIVDEIDRNEFVVELQADWTQILAGETDAYYNYDFKLDFAKDTFVSLTNGVKNAAFELDLNYSGSLLNQADNTSPVIDGIVQTADPSTYEITMSEPVKLADKDNAGDTESTQQTAGIPTVLAEFQGKDKDGKAVVIPATVVDYSDKKVGGDKKFNITTAEAQALQTLVNSQGYNENWTVVVRSISDDIGNTASTLTKDFVVKSTTKSTGFEIESHENGFANKVIAFNAEGAGKQDKIEVTFTKGVNVAGPDNLTSVYNWTLNGTRLSNLSNVASIEVENVYGDNKDGYEKVIITFADDRAFGSTSNVVSVTKGITSLDGTVLSGEFEVVAHTVNVSAIENAIDGGKVEFDYETGNINLELPADTPASAITIAAVSSALPETVKIGDDEYKVSATPTENEIKAIKDALIAAVNDPAKTSIEDITAADLESIAIALKLNGQELKLNLATIPAE